MKTQLDRTDFTGAILTGAYTQDWNITHNTNFRGVKAFERFLNYPAASFVAGALEDWRKTKGELI